MTELAFKFETDPQMGVPRLHPMTGTSLAWNARDLQQMEDQLRSRYESLVRDGAGTLQFKGKTLTVKKQEGDTSRQPTLEVHVPVTTTAIAPVPSALPPAPPSSLATPVPQATWFAGWLDEIDPLVRSERLLPAEAAMLSVVRDELRGLAEKATPRAQALLLFVSIVSLADRLSRAHQPGLPQPYPFAMSGLERLLETDAPTPWGALPATLNAEPLPSWVARFWHLLKG